MYSFNASTSTLSHEALVDLLERHVADGPARVIIEARTDAKLLKTGNPFGPVAKRSRVSVTIGLSYATAVNFARWTGGMPADFKPQPRPWGERVGGCFIRNKGRLYVECIVEQSLSHQYEMADGTPLSDEDVRPFLPARRPETSGVILRDYALESIEAVTVEMERYAVTA